MTDLRQAAQAALDAMDDSGESRFIGIIADLRAALAAQQAETKEFDADDMQEQWTAAFNVGRAAEIAQQAAPIRCAKPSLSCPNMKDRENDTSMSYEHYDCKVCGGHIALDYDDMR